MKKNGFEFQYTFQDKEDEKQYKERYQEEYQKYFRNCEMEDISCIHLLIKSVKKLYKVPLIII